ncbi:MAG: type II toxin-antitoxin system VapC family toxin [Bacteroidetes bacterium]|nr:type II toxin-antitoxin system VapC family toxin [Bacteroidota bacterium]
MQLLLDTHTFIWSIEDDKRLSQKAKKGIENQDNAIILSIASLWEMSIKISIGKLELKKPFEDVISYVREKGIEVLSINFEHTLLVSKLDFHHKDPFDRLIIAQAKIENMTIVSKDKLFDDYNIKRLW